MREGTFLGLRVFPRGIAICVIASFILTGAPATFAASVFDVRRDFSTNENPNGVWSYGWQEKLGGAFTLLTETRPASADNGVPCEVWEFAHYTAPLLIHFPQANKETGLSDGGRGQYPPGTLLYYAAVDDSAPQNLATIRFTAPSNAVYRVATSVRTYLDGPPGGDVDFHVAVNGHRMGGAFLRTPSAAALVEKWELTEGSTVDFSVGRGADGHQYGSGLKIRIGITALPGRLEQLATPAEYAETEARGGSSLLRDVIRLQHLHVAQQFPPYPIKIRELRFRPSAVYGEPFDVVIPDFRVRMSTTERGPRTLKARFAANVGDDDTLVFRGPLHASSQFTGPAGGPKDFDIVIRLTKPFIYDPSRGNLLLDYRNITGSKATYIDAGASENAGRAFDLDASSRTATTVDDGAEVVRFVFELATNAVPKRFRQ
jgi:hypothetical protein